MKVAPAPSLTEQQQRHLKNKRMAEQKRMEKRRSSQGGGGRWSLFSSNHGRGGNQQKQKAKQMNNNNNNNNNNKITIRIKPQQRGGSVANGRGSGGSNDHTTSNAANARRKSATSSSVLRAPVSHTKMMSLSAEFPQRGPMLPLPTNAQSIVKSVQVCVALTVVVNVLYAVFMFDNRLDWGMLSDVQYCHWASEFSFSSMLLQSMTLLLQCYLCMTVSRRLVVLTVSLQAISFSLAQAVAWHNVGFDDHNEVCTFWRQGILLVWLFQFIVYGIVFYYYRRVEQLYQSKIIRALLWNVGLSALSLLTVSAVIASGANTGALIVRTLLLGLDRAVTIALCSIVLHRVVKQQHMRAQRKYDIRKALNDERRMHTARRGGAASRVRRFRHDEAEEQEEHGKDNMSTAAVDRKAVDSHSFARHLANKPGPAADRLSVGQQVDQPVNSIAEH